MTTKEMQIKKFLEVFEESLGNITQSCKAANIGRMTYYDLRKKNEEFKQATDDVIAGTGDFVESKLVGRIKSNCTAATIFYCKTKLKDRGYIEKTQQEHSGAVENRHTISDEDKQIMERLGITVND
jgi:hypothetical protein